MRRAAVLLALLFSACSGPRILPDKVGLPVARGDTISLCPDDGGTDTTRLYDCVLSSAADALAPYEKELRRQKWEERLPDRWVSRPDVAGVSRCLAITTLDRGDGQRDGALLKFEVGNGPGDRRSQCHAPATLS